MSQTERILKHLKRGSEISQKEAVELFGCYRLAARIYDLKCDGHNIITKIVRKGTTKFAKYALGVSNG